MLDLTEAKINCLVSQGETSGCSAVPSVANPALALSLRGTGKPGCLGDSASGGLRRLARERRLPSHPGLISGPSHAGL